MRLILPLILILIASFLFFGMTTSLFTEIDGLRVQRDLAQADLDEAKALSDRFNTLQAQADAIGDTQLTQLKSLLPESVDTVDLLNKINGISEGSKLVLSDVDIKVEEAARSSRNAKVVPIAGLGTVTFNFSITGAYPAFRQFLTNLERSLRLVDISAITFSSVEKDPYQYNVELKTYWLK